MQHCCNEEEECLDYNAGTLIVVKNNVLPLECFRIAYAYILHPT